MPVTPTYPGVYIQEIPSGVRAIIGVSTSVAAFVGRFARGPQDAPVQLFNSGDFERRMGGLLRESETTYAVQQFFLNGGSQAWAVRVAPGAEAAWVVMEDIDGNPVLRATAGQQVGDRSVDNPGAWGNNLRIDIDYASRDPDNEFNLSVSEIREEDGREVVVRSEDFRNLSMDAGRTNFALAVVNDGSTLIQLSQDSGWIPALPALPERPAPTGTSSGAAISLASLSNIDSTIAMTIDTEPAVDVEIAAADLPASPAAARGVLESAIRAAAPTDPRFAQAVVRFENGRLRVLLGRTGANYAPELIVTFVDSAGNLAETLALRDDDDAVQNVQQYWVGSPNATAVGFRGDVVVGVDDSGATATALRGDRGAKTGIFALEDIDLFNILCIPEASTLDGPGEITNLAQVMAAAETYCEERRAMVLIDPAADVDTLDDARGFVEDLAVASLRHRNSAAYFPRVRIPDPLDEGRLRSFGPSGTVAGLYARTDADRGVWKAPAGIESGLRGVLDLVYRLSDAENGQLNPLGLNCLRTFDNIGTVSWGARTLQGADILASDWKYIPVRRLALFIEESLYRGLQWAVFEPNDEPLWAEIRLAAGSFMQRLFRQGAFQGATPRAAYFVQCDATTTTPADQVAGIVNVLIGFAPLRPAEFVIVSLRLLAGQAQT